MGMKNTTGRLGIVSLVLALGLATQAPAQTPEGDACTAFKWPIGEARQALAGTVAKLASGAKAPGDFELALAPTEQVAFPTKPERAPKHAGTFGGFVTAEPPKGGTFQVTLSDEAWIDVVQDGKIVKSSGFSGKAGCAGVRKSVRFSLPSSQPVTIQVSGVDAQSIRVDLRGVD